MPSQRPHHRGGLRSGGSVRARLAALVGGLLLAAGGCLLLVVYLVVSNGHAERHTFSIPGPTHSAADLGLLSRHLIALAQAQAQAQRSADLHDLLVVSGLALAALAAASVLIGWLVAGRMLRPIRTITATTREISATNLHRRLALPGPDDELKKLADTVDDLLARLEHAFDAQRQFVANASHELRTPLARERTVVQVALRDPDASVESLRAACEEVLATGADQERLIKALLVLARSQVAPRPGRPLDLAAVARKVVREREPDIADRGLRLNAALHPASLHGNPDLIERMVANLVDNALRHNTEEGRLDIGTATVGQHAVLTVTNTGPPVEAADIDRLLEPFQRTAAARTSRTDGLGLGLSIVRAVATAHAAALSLRPGPVGGLTVEVSFPAAVR